MSKKILLGILLSGALCHLQAQENRRLRKLVPDTIVIYDTIYITDTIRLTRPPQALTVLPGKEPAVLTGNSRNKGITKIIISSDGTATLLPIPIMDSVNLVHNQNDLSMKKIGFFGVLFFAFQHLIPAQNNFYADLGAGAYRLTTSTTLKSNIAPAFKAGLGYRRSFLNNKFSVGIEANVNYLLRADFDPAATIGGGFPNPIGDSQNKDKKPVMFNIPATLQWHSKWIAPFTGVEYYNKLDPVTGPLVAENGAIETQNYRIPYNAWGWLAGVEVPFAGRWSATAAYYGGLSRERSVSTSFGSIYTTMRRVELSLRYRLK